MSPKPNTRTVAIKDIACMSSTHEAILTFDYAFGGHPAKVVVKRTADGFGEASLSIDNPNSPDGQFYFMKTMPLGVLRAFVAFIDGLPPIVREDR